MGKFKRFERREEAIKLKKDGLSYQEIADKFGVSKSHIWYHLRKEEMPELITVTVYSKLLSENKELRKQLNRIKEFVNKQAEI